MINLKKNNKQFQNKKKQNKYLTKKKLNKKDEPNLFLKSSFIFYCNNGCTRY